MCFRLKSLKSQKNTWFKPGVLEVRDKRPQSLCTATNIFCSVYDLIQLYWQIIYQNDQIFTKKWLKPSPPAFSISNLKKTMKMTLHFVISTERAGTVFSPCLWQLWWSKQHGLVFYCNLNSLWMPKDTAGTYLLPHYGIGVFRNVYFLAGQH